MNRVLTVFVGRVLDFIDLIDLIDLIDPLIEVVQP